MRMKVVTVITLTIRQVMNRLYYVDALSSLAVDLVDNNVAMASNGLPNHHHRGEYRYTVPIYL